MYNNITMLSKNLTNIYMVKWGFYGEFIKNKDVKRAYEWLIFVGFSHTNQEKQDF